MSADTNCNFGEIDPIKYIMGKGPKISLETLNPKQVANLYKELLEGVPIEVMLSENHSAGVYHGLKSIRRLLEPDYPDWLNISADKDLVKKALPAKTPYQQLYLTLFRFDIPSDKEKWPTVYAEKDQWTELFDSISRGSLVYGKNKQLYHLEATWTPEKDCPIHSSSEATFKLVELRVRKLTWDDEVLLSKIKCGDWNEPTSVIAGIQLAARASSGIFESRAKMLRGWGSKLADLPTTVF